MKILFESDQLLYYPGGGMTVYLYHLLHGLLKQPDFEAVCAYSSLASSRREHLEQMRQINFDGRYEQRTLPLPGRLARLPGFHQAMAGHFYRGMELFHCISGNLPGWFVPKRLPTVMTLHDVVFLRHAKTNFTDADSSWYRREIERDAKIADVIIAVSDFTRREAVELLDVDPAKFVIVPNAAQFSAGDVEETGGYPESLLRLGFRDDPYFLAVSVISPRKNYETLLEAYDRFRRKNPQVKLVIVGHAGWRCREVQHRISQTPGVIHLPDCGRSDLIRLYRNALGYFNLSLYEGFGIPLLEAMLCRCCCCYAAGSAMDEICGETGVRISPCDVDAAAGAMERFSSPGTENEQLKIAARNRAETFTWDRTAAETAAVYRSLLSHHQ